MEERLARLKQQVGLDETTAARLLQSAIHPPSLAEAALEARVGPVRRNPRRSWLGPVAGFLPDSGAAWTLSIFIHVLLLAAAVYAYRHFVVRPVQSPPPAAQVPEFAGAPYLWHVDDLNGIGLGASGLAASDAEPLPEWPRVGRPGLDAGVTGPGPLIGVSTQWWREPPPSAGLQRAGGRHER